MSKINCHQDRDLFILLTTLVELFPWLFFHWKQECLFIIHLLWRENSSNKNFLCFTCFAVFVTSKHNSSSTFFAKCVRGRHLDKLIYQENGWIQALAKFECDTFKEEWDSTLVNLKQKFLKPKLLQCENAEPEEAPLNYASNRSWTNDHLLFPTIILQALSWWPDIRQ